MVVMYHFARLISLTGEGGSRGFRLPAESQAWSAWPLSSPGEHSGTTVWDTMLLFITRQEVVFRKCFVTLLIAAQAPNPPSYLLLNIEPAYQGPGPVWQGPVRMHPRQD